MDLFERPLARRLLGADEPRDLLRVVALVVIYGLLDALTRSASSLSRGDRFGSVLAWRAVTANPMQFAALAVGIGAIVVLGRGRVFAPWSSLEHGDVLRWLASAPLLLLVWYGTAYEYNYFLDQWHTTDRLLVLGLAIAAWFRPVMLLPFALQFRIVVDQFLTPFGASAGQNILQLLVTALVVLAAMQLLAAATDDGESASAIFLIGVAIAAHFFASGRSKIALDWATTTEIGNFAFSSYTAGWMGGGDGGWARAMSSIADALKIPLVIGTLVLEVGSVIAVFRHWLLRWWLLGWAGFHLAIFAMSGFWLLEWVVLEVALFIVLTRRDLTDWVGRNDTIARGLLAAFLVVALGIPLFRPPKLAWLDSKVSYGYEIEGVGVSGDEYHIALDDLAPLQQDLSFLFAHFRESPELLPGYGAVGWVELYEQLEAVATFDELTAVQASYDPIAPDVRAESAELIRRWVEHANARGDSPWFLPHPPPHYWTSRPDPVYEFSEPLRAVEVVLVTAIVDGDVQRFTREPVLRVTVGDEGDAEVEWRAGDPTDG